MVFCERPHSVIRSKYTDIDANFMSIITLLVPVYKNGGILTSLIIAFVFTRFFPESMQFPGNIICSSDLECKTIQ